MTSGSAAALLALEASDASYHAPLAAVASSKPQYSMLNLPSQAWLLASSRRCLIAFTTVSVWPFDEPVRGSEETITSFSPAPPAAGAAVGWASAGVAVGAAAPAAVGAAAPPPVLPAPHAAIRPAKIVTSRTKL